MIKFGFLLLVLLVFGFPFAMLLIAIIGAYPMTAFVIVPVVVLSVMGAIGANT